jgi:hypothetical protein
MNNNRVYFLMKMYQSGVVVTTIPNGGTIWNFRRNSKPSRFIFQSHQFRTEKLFRIKMFWKRKKRFETIGCTTCHIPKIQTGNAPYCSFYKQPFVRLRIYIAWYGRRISRQYTVILVTGNEWRTPPLWGIGLIKNCK